MSANQADHAVGTMCRVLGISRSGFYAWCARGASAHQQEDDRLRQLVYEVHRASRGTYGAPRVHAQLRRQGVRLGKKRVARLMREAGIAGVSPRRFVVTTRAGKGPFAPDLVRRHFKADGPNRLWVADITYVPTLAGFLYLATVLDVWSRRVVGWAMRTHLQTELVLESLEMAIEHRRPATQVVHHSDHGCQYTSVAFTARCQAKGVTPSMGTVGDSYDNAMAESFFGTLECELLARETFNTPREARAAVFDYIEGFYNPSRLHSALGYRSPMQFEAEQALHQRRDVA